MLDTSTITVNGKTIGIDLEGYLLDPSDWNHEVACFLAGQEELELEDHRWLVVNFVRDFYEFRQSVPEARFALKAMKESLGKEMATRKYLYQLFPYGYGQQACKIAGMRMPKKLLLDL
jgi:tRNA 2-thiouridine synthesizing protein E